MRDQSRVINLGRRPFCSVRESSMQRQARPKPRCQTSLSSLVSSTLCTTSTLMPGRSIFVFLNLKSAALKQKRSEAVGVVKVIVQSGHINGPSWLGRAPNPFVSICASRAKVTTDPQPATYDPSWITQTFFLLVESPNEVIRMKVYDRHEHRKHNALLGEASFDMSRLMESGMELDAHLALLKQNKRIGDLLCSLFYFPITLPPRNETAIPSKLMWALSKTLVLSAW
ncbi:hypothetical protein C8R47DRAFT_1253553 [Mycena vitilis]|nr:hypothetical protein C8R47DRAFT_1253553 [Mycena vitilis]